MTWSIVVAMLAPVALPSGCTPLSHVAGTIGADSQQPRELGAVVDQFAVPRLDRFEQGHDRLTGVRLQRTVLGVVADRFIHGAAGRCGEDVEARDAEVSPGPGLKLVD